MFRLVVSLILIGIFIFPNVSFAGESDWFWNKAKEILAAEDPKLLYSPIFKAGTEGISWVRHIYGPAEYILLGSPSLTLNLINGGPLGLTKKIGWDLAKNMIKEAVRHPEKTSRKIAKVAYDVGLRAYRDNYRFYKKYKPGQKFSEDEAKQFVLNWYVQDYMSAAKKLYNGITAYEKKDDLQRPLDLVLDQVETETLKEIKGLFGTLTELEVSAILRFELESYPPYKSFHTKTLSINQSLSQLMVVSPDPKEIRADKDREMQPGTIWLAQSSGLNLKEPVTGMEFVYIKPGTFIMGSPKNEQGRDGDGKQRQVTLTRGFYLQTTEATQAQWKAVMGNNPSRYRGCGDDCPVEKVSWNDVQEFINKLNQMENSNKYRLPTEAEWEYACRAGSNTRFSFGDDAAVLGQYAWYAGNSEKRPHPVGQKRPNAWGLYDMHGNVWEWVQDWLGKYPSASVSDPTGPSSDTTTRVIIRGGSWIYGPDRVRSAFRRGFRPGGRYGLLGFRLARNF